jgi:HK97 family phage major capsid protein
MSTLRELIEKRAGVWAQAQEFNTRTKAGETMSPEDDAAWERALADVDQFTADIEKREKTEALDARFSEIDARTTVVDTRGNTHAGDTGTADEYRETFQAYLRFGNARLNARQQDLMQANDFATRAQAVGSGAAGGFTVPQGFWDKVTETLKFYAMVREIAEVLTTDTGNPFPWATNDDTANIGELLGENTATVDLDLVFAQKTLGAYMFSSKNIKASRQFLQDSGVNPENFVAKKIGQRLGRIINQMFTTGTGTTQPQGFVTGATTGETAPAGNTILVPYDSLINLQHSVDAAYRDSGNCVFVMHDLSLAIVRS